MDAFIFLLLAAPWLVVPALLFILVCGLECCVRSAPRIIAALAPPAHPKAQAVARAMQREVVGATLVGIHLTLWLCSGSLLVIGPFGPIPT